MRLNNFNKKRRLSLPSDLPVIMGIVNCTPDSFYAESRFQPTFIPQILQKKADILDIGGQSTRPGSVRVDWKTEWSRIEPFIKGILDIDPNYTLSVDTYYSQVALKAVEAGVQIINDVTGGQVDSEIIDVAMENNCTYVVTHLKYELNNMQANPSYSNCVEEVHQYFDAFINKYFNLDIWIDPGFGFGKSLDHNWELLSNLHRFKSLKKPILIGISRKKMIQQLLDVTADQSLIGSTIAHAIAFQHGANIIRTHDIEAGIQMKQIFQKILASTKH
jgi:dihydropteroate synthase